MAFFNLLLLCFSVVLALAVDVSYERQAASMCPQLCRCGMVRPQTTSSRGGDGSRAGGELGSGPGSGSGAPSVQAASGVSEEQMAVNCSGLNLTNIPFTIEDSRAGR